MSAPSDVGSSGPDFLPTPLSLLGSTAQTFGWSLQGVTAPQVSISATQAVPGLECPPWSPQSFLFLTEGGWSSTHGLGETLGPMPGWASPVEGTWPESLGPNGRFGSGGGTALLGSSRQATRCPQLWVLRASQMPRMKPAAGGWVGCSETSPLDLHGAWPWPSEARGLQGGKVWGSASVYPAKGQLHPA